jgi:O-antigen ligase
MIQPNRSILSARNRLLAMFIVLCILDVTLVIIARDKWAIGRILLTIVVMYFVLQGRQWAKWLMMGICSFLVIILITMVLLLSSKLSVILIVGSLIMAILSAIILIYMLSSRDLTRYFSWKRQNYSQ